MIIIGISKKKLPEVDEETTDNSDIHHKLPRFLAKTQSNTDKVIISW